ncbi:MAG: YceD family protein [Bacillota bacterium]
MKWTIHELIKKADSDIDLNRKINLKEFLSEDFNDVVDILDTSVSGNFEYIKVEDTFAFYLNIKTTLTMLCSITLKKVNVDLDFNTDLYFSRDYIDDDTHVIDGITIDLKPYIFSEIITEKPMRVVSQDAYENYEEDIEKLDEEEIVENSPFAKLKK